MPAALVALGLAAVLTGCGVGQGPLANASERDLRQRAENAGFAMAKAGRQESAVEHARRVVGDIGSARIELMESEGTGVDGYVVLRITSIYDDDGPMNNDSSASDCFRYAFGDGSGGKDPDRVRCPTTAPLTLPAPPFDPELPAHAEARLRGVLQRPVTPSSVAGSFRERGVTARLHQVDDRVGIAVSASPGECLMGRRLADGTVEVWRVPRVLALPGELGCDAEAAADGLGMEPPH